MATNNAQVKFVYITRAKYNSATKNANTIYIVKETNNEEALYLGAKLLNKNYVDTAIANAGGGGSGGFSPTLLHTKAIGDGDIDFPCDYLTGFGMASTSGWFMLEFYFFNSDLYIPQTHTFIIKGAPAFGTTFPVVSVSNVNVSVFGEGNSSQTSIMLRLEGNPDHYESMTNCTMKIYKL